MAPFENANYSESSSFIAGSGIDVSNGVITNTSTTLLDLHDTIISSLDNGDTIVYNASLQKWVTGFPNLGSLNEVNINLNTIQNNHLLKYNSTSGYWENNFATLSDLHDTIISNLDDGDTLVYNASIQKWVTDNPKLDVPTNVGIVGQILSKGPTLDTSSWINPTFFNGTALYSPGAGSFGTARYNFSNSTALAFSGSNYGAGHGLYCDIMTTMQGIQIGSTNGSVWRGTEILSLNQATGKWQIFNFGTGVTNLAPGSSDDRIKTHEQILTGETCINYIKQIVPKKYNKYNIILTQSDEKLLESGEDPFKDKRTGDVVIDAEFTPNVEYGYIAQEIQKIDGLSEIVYPGDDKNIWSLNYKCINTLLLGAVKDLIKRIETLEKRSRTE